MTIAMMRCPKISQPDWNHRSVRFGDSTEVMVPGTFIRTLAKKILEFFRVFPGFWVIENPETGNPKNAFKSLFI
jgi:hypothetical protein